MKDWEVERKSFLIDHNLPHYKVTTFSFGQEGLQLQSGFIQILGFSSFISCNKERKKMSSLFQKYGDKHEKVCNAHPSWSQCNLPLRSWPGQTSSAQVWGILMTCRCQFHPLDLQMGSLALQHTLIYKYTVYKKIWNNHLFLFCVVVAFKIHLELDGPHTWDVDSTRPTVNYSDVVVPGTAVKNLTASLCPWKQSWACAMEQKGTKVPAVTLSLFSSPYTRMALPGWFCDPAVTLQAVIAKRKNVIWAASITALSLNTWHTELNILFTHVLIEGWRWWHHFLFQPTVGYMTPSEPWSSQKRSPAYQCLWQTHNDTKVKRGAWIYFNTRSRPSPYRASCWRKAQCPHPADADMYAREKVWGLSPGG